MNPGPPRHLVTLKQAAEARPWATVRFQRTLIASKRIAYFKVAGRVLVDLDELDAYAERGRVEPPSPLRLVKRATNSGP